MELYRSAAIEGHAGACYELARKYSVGNITKSIKMDLREAQHYATKGSNCNPSRYNVPGHEQNKSIDLCRGILAKINTAAATQTTQPNPW